MSNQWLNDMRNKMEDHAEDIPDGLWDDIKDELFNETDKNIIVPINDLKAQSKNFPKNNVKNLWYRVTGIAASIAVFFIGGRELLRQYYKKEASQPIVNTVKKQEEKYSNTEVDNIVGKENLYKNYADKDLIISNKNAATKNIVSLHVFNKNLNAFKINISENQSAANLIKQFEDVIKDALIVENQSDNKVDEIDEIFSKEKKKPNEDLKLAKKDSKKSWMLSMLTGNASKNSVEQFPGYATLNGATMSISDEIWTAGYEDNPLMDILLGNQDQQIDAKIRHKVPVTFGLSVFRNLDKNKKWGIGTGINYTKLATELQSGSNSYFIKSDQTIHYLGIPVQINYNVVNKGRFTGYITAGGLVEKAIAGNIKTKYIVNNEIKEETTENINKKPLQLSVNSALGVQFKVVDKIGIYAEPGIGYHFKDNSSFSTIYNDKPLNFNLKFGIRLLID